MCVRDIAEVHHTEAVLRHTTEVLLLTITETVQATAEVEVLHQATAEVRLEARDTAEVLQGAQATAEVHQEATEDKYRQREQTYKTLTI